MQKKFEKNWTKIKVGCQSGRKVVPHNSKSDLPLALIPLLAARSNRGLKENKKKGLPTLSFFFTKPTS